MKFTREFIASYAFVERNFNLVKRYWGWEIVWLAYSIANALSITFIGTGVGSVSGQTLNTSYLVFYLLIGTLVWHYLSAVFENISEMIAWERWEGTIEYTFMAPITRLTHMFGQTLFAMVYSFLHTGIILIVVAFFFHLDLSRSNIVGGSLMLLAGSVSFVGLGTMAAVLPLLFPERGAQMTNVFQALLLLFSGVYFPISVLPNWMQAVARLSPATYVLIGMREALLHGATNAALWPYIWKLALVGLIFLPAGLWVFSQAETYAKRAGRLHRNG